MCNHPIERLQGNADGVLCLKCGEQFPDFKSLKKSKQEKPKKKEVK